MVPGEASTPALSFEMRSGVGIRHTSKTGIVQSHRVGINIEWSTNDELRSLISVPFVQKSDSGLPLGKTSEKENRRVHCLRSGKAPTLSLRSLEAR
jgi:hypothetical protein